VQAGNVSDGAMADLMAKHYEGVVSASLYVLSSLTMTAATKYAASVWRFPGSSTLLNIECIVTAVGMYALASPNRYTPLSWPILSTLPLVTLAKAFNMSLSFIAMRRVSLPVYNVLKRLQPVYAMLLDKVVRGTSTTPMEKMAVLLLSLGSIITGIGDLDFDLMGYLIAIAAAGGQSLYLVLARRASDVVSGGLSHVDLLFYTALYNIGIFCPLAVLEGSEVVTFLGRPGECARLLYFLVPYIAVGALLNYTTYWCTAVNSPLATAVAGSLKGVLSTVGGVIFFGSGLSVLGWSGFALSTLGGYVYSEAQSQKRRHIQKAQ